VLWSRDCPAPYCLTEVSISLQYICEKCALRLAATRSGLLGYPTLEMVQEHIRQGIERSKSFPK
jgi:hypothetical protein